MCTVAPSRSLASGGRPAALDEQGFLADVQCPPGIEGGVHLDELRHDASPPGLVVGAEASAVVAVEVLVEEDVIAPVRVGLELLGVAVHRASALLVAQEGPAKTIGNLLAHLEEVHELARA